MSLNASWLAFEKVDREIVLEKLGLQVVGETDDELSAELCCAETVSGWWLIYSNSGRFGGPLDPAALSENAHMVTTDMSETVMCSRSSGWRNGVMIWEVDYDPDLKAGDVEVTGDPPPQFAAIRARVIEEQQREGDADYIFDIPVELSAALCGYSDPLGQARTGLTFQVLKAVREPEKRPSLFGFLRGLFGR
jgi:hypothetical protein